MAVLYGAARYVVLIQLVLICSIRAQTSLPIDPSMVRLFVHQGFLNFTSTANAPTAYRTALGAPLTVEVFMSATYTSNYDYMIEGCSANGYQFIDQHSCMQCDAVFVVQAETPQYWEGRRDKQTLIHLLAYQPIDTDFINIECSFLLVQCAGCAQKACQRGVIPGKDTPSNFKRFTKSVELQLMDGIFGARQGRAWCTDNYELPWWIILIIVILAILLIIAVILLIFCCLRRHDRSIVLPATRKILLETDNYRTPSESPSQYISPERHASPSNSARIATIT